MSNRFDLKVVIKSEEKIYNVISLFRKLEDEDFHRVFLERPLIKGQPKNYRVDGKNIILIQCTSVPSTNSELIYESDIVKIENELFVVIWDDDNGFMLFNEKGHEIFHGGVLMEIVGNFHLNPELLKNEK